MRLPSILRRRPSAALLVSCVALFVSLGGASYAAVSIPNHSVGAAQLKKNAVTNSKIAKNAVTFRKIQPNSVGRVRANVGQLQERVNGKCGAGSAIGTIEKTGKVNCNASLPSGLQTTSNTAAISPTATGPTTITSLSLPAGVNYLAFANPMVAVSGVTGNNEQRVHVNCTLAVGSNTQTRAATVIGSPGTTTDVSIPLQLAGPSGTATVACTAKAQSGTLPTTSVTASLDALQINPS